MSSIDYRNLGKAICQEQAGLRVDRYLGEHFMFLSRSEWDRRLKKKEVLVNDTPVKSSYRLKLKDHVCYYAPSAREPEVRKDIKVIWEKEGVLGIYKPPNLPMHEGGAYRKNTFHELIQNELGPNWAAVHRLDRETSGIVLCAESADLRAELSASLRNRKVDKTYLAIVHGQCEKDSWLIDAPLGETKDTSFRLKHWVIDDGLASQTQFEVIEKTDKFSFLRVSPLTGRTHQIRVHSSWNGHHLVGEKKYHPNEEIYLEYLNDGFTKKVEKSCLFERLCLHAKTIKFIHPTLKTMCEIDTEVPEDMSDIWEELRKK